LVGISPKKKIKKKNQEERKENVVADGGVATTDGMISLAMDSIAIRLQFDCNSNAIQ